MKILCFFGLHKWEIHQVGKTKRKNFLFTNYHRTCQRCGKEQGLQRPEEYHPTAFVWVDLIEEEK